MSAEEIESAARRAIDETGATAPGDMGRVMGVLMKQLEGRADGRTVSETVKRLLSG
jgi:uncharacterized protein YqeY